MNAVTEDSVFQGRVKLFQPETGFRAGTDSLLLAAALPDLAKGEALEPGCGCGGALLPAAWRLNGLRFTGVEVDAGMARLAERGVLENGFGERAGIVEAEAGAWVRAFENRFDLVFANPPFFEPGKISPPGAGKPAAYIESLPLDGWIKAMAFAARPRAPIVLIHRAADLARILAPLERVAGDIMVLPVAAGPGAEARRVIVKARKGLKRGPVRLLAPFLTHDGNGKVSAGLEAVRRGERIIWGEPSGAP